MDTSEYYEDLKHSPKYEEAKKRVKSVRRFYVRLGSFIVIAIFLILLNLFTDPGYFWAIFPILGMGLAIGLNYTRLFGVPFIANMDEEWENRKTWEEILKYEDSGSIQEWYTMRRKKKEELDFDLDEDIELNEMDLRELNKEFKEKWDR